MKTDGGGVGGRAGRPVNIRDPEFLTLQAVATLAANPFCATRVKVASVGLGLSACRRRLQLGHTAL